MSFVKGQSYSNSTANVNGTSKATVTTSAPDPSGPIMTRMCTEVTKTFAVFRVSLVSGVVLRLKIYRDALGQFVYPKGRFPGAPIYRG